MPLGPQELIAELLQRVRPGSPENYGNSRMPMYDPRLLVPRGSIPQDEAEDPRMHMTPDELEEYGNQTPGGSSPYSRPLPGVDTPIEGPGSEREDIEQTRKERQQQLIEKFLEDYKGY
jgi:hypothetical protein